MSCKRLMSFSEALSILKKGEKIARAGWNGKGMFLQYISNSDYSIKVPIVEDSILVLCPWIGMKTAQDSFVPWLASQTDILADDWITL